MVKKKKRSAKPGKKHRDRDAAKQNKNAPTSSSYPSSDELEGPPPASADVGYSEPGSYSGGTSNSESSYVYEEVVIVRRRVRGRGGAGKKSSQSRKSSKNRGRDRRSGWGGSGRVTPLAVDPEPYQESSSELATLPMTSRVVLGVALTLVLVTVGLLFAPAIGDVHWGTSAIRYPHIYTHTTVQYYTRRTVVKDGSGFGATKTSPASEVVAAVGLNASAGTFLLIASVCLLPLFRPLCGYYHLSVRSRGARTTMLALALGCSVFATTLTIASWSSIVALKTGLQIGSILTITGSAASGVASSLLVFLFVRMVRRDCTVASRARRRATIVAERRARGEPSDTESSSSSSSRTDAWVINASWLLVASTVAGGVGLVLLAVGLAIPVWKARFSVTSSYPSNHPTMYTMSVNAVRGLVVSDVVAWDPQSAHPERRSSSTVAIPTSTIELARFRGIAFTTAIVFVFASSTSAILVRARHNALWRHRRTAIIATAATSALRLLFIGVLCATAPTTVRPQLATRFTTSHIDLANVGPNRATFAQGKSSPVAWAGPATGYWFMLAGCVLGVAASALALVPAVQTAARINE